MRALFIQFSKTDIIIITNLLNNFGTKKGLEFYLQSRIVISVSILI